MACLISGERETRKNDNAAGFDIEIVRTGLKINAAHFNDAQIVTLFAVFGRHIFKLMTPCAIDSS